MHNLSLSVMMVTLSLSISNTRRGNPGLTSVTQPSLAVQISSDNTGMQDIKKVQSHTVHSYVTMTTLYTAVLQWPQFTQLCYNGHSVHSCVTMTTLYTAVLQWPQFTQLCYNGHSVHSCVTMTTVYTAVLQWPQFNSCVTMATVYTAVLQ